MMLCVYFFIIYNESVHRTEGVPVTNCSSCGSIGSLLFQHPRRSYAIL
jgi:hypothetical protein